MRFPLFPIPSGFQCVRGRRSRFPRRESVQRCARSPVPIPGGTSPAIAAPWPPALVLPARSTGNLVSLKELGEKKDAAGKRVWGCHRAKPTEAEWGFSQDPSTHPSRGIKMCWEETLQQVMPLQGREKEKKPSMGRAALATPRAVDVCHPSPSLETPVWVFWWYHWDGPFPAGRTLRG